MIKQTSAALTLVAIVFLAGCSGNKMISVTGAYHIDQDGYGFGPGADKIILSMHSNNKFDVKTGPVTMLEGTWAQKDNNVIFSEGQGAIVVNYRAEKDRLVPMKDGKDVTGWRWKRN